jgi:phage-related tail protein
MQNFQSIRRVQLVRTLQRDSNHFCSTSANSDVACPELGVVFFTSTSKPFSCIVALKSTNKATQRLKAIEVEEQNEKHILQLTERHRNVRNRAEKIVAQYFRNSPEGMAQRKSRARVDQNVGDSC